MGLLPQSSVAPEGIRVLDLVSRGRFPYRQFLKSMTKEDYAAVEEAMSIMGITELADRAVDELGRSAPKSLDCLGSLTANGYSSS